jgi:putative ABC transport system permease protein
LRTLGASRKQIYLITISEYLFLGLLSALTGVVIALVASYLLAIFVFESVFVPSILMILVLIVLIVGLTVIIGLINSLAVINKSPLEALRKE